MDWEEKAEQLYAYLESVLQQTGDLVIEQTPLLVQEFFMWFTVHHIFWMAVAVIPMLLGLYLHQLGKDPDNHKRGKDVYYDSDGGWAVVVAIPSVIGIIIFLTNLYGLLQLLVAPRIYLLEKLSYWFNN